MRLHLTDDAIAAIAPPPFGQAFYRDTGKKAVSGLAVRVTKAGTKTFVLEMLVKKKVRRMTLGRCADFGVAKARRKAEAERSKIADGFDPIAERKKAGSATVTLDAAYADYIKARSLKPRTVGNYGRVIEIAFVDWRSKPLASIGRDAVVRRFAKLRDDNGPAWANLCMSVLRAVFNFAAGKYADDAGASPFAINPIKVLSETRSWSKLDRRRSLIRPHELRAWYEGVRALGSATARDYLLLLIFTGLRRREASGLQWADVDFKARTLTVKRTKNGRPHLLPLPSFICEMLKARATFESKFVFPSGAASGHLEEAKRAYKQVAEASGVTFTLHDLRRTFATTAEALDIPAYALKRLLNHTDSASDVTAGYLILDVERLREPMERIARSLERAMGVTETNVVPIGLQGERA